MSAPQSDQRAVKQAALEEEGDRVGADFRLGERTGAWTRTRFRARAGWGCAFTFILVVAGWIPIVVVGGQYRLITAALYGGLLLAAILTFAIPPSEWEDRLFQFDLGLVLVNPQLPEPVVVRWDDLASVSLTLKSGYDEDYVSSCELRDRSGRSMTLPHTFTGAHTTVTAAAEDLLARQLLPGLIARYDAGESVSFQGLIVARSGLDITGAGPGTPRRLAWPEISRVESRLHGHRLTLQGSSRSAARVKLAGAPNDFLAQHVIVHAARQAGVPVTVE